jgi:UDP-N-acetyl-2-amino-2-deoxyglucuronate dehydrogenase
MIEIGIVGGGGISETHARAARETKGVEISAIYGSNREKVERLRELYGGHPYHDFQAFLKHEPLDMVIIGSPSGMHAEQGIAAARRGLHVLVEKPIDITTARVDLLISECERARVKLGVCFQDRFAPDICRLKQMIDAGRMGRPILVSGRVKWFRPPEYYSSSRWRSSWDLAGGGALMNQGVHTVDLLLWLIGDVRRVYAKTAMGFHSIQVEDTVAATLEFANGALGTLEVATSVYPGYQRRVELTGTEGTLILEHDRIISADLRTPLDEPLSQADENTNASATSPVVSDVSGHKRILADFLNAIQTNTEPLCDGREGRRSVELVEAVYKSARTDQAVTLTDSED